MNNDEQRSGFTLIEVMVVVLILGILAALVAPNVFRHVGESKATTARTQIEMLGAALDAYRLDNDRYPTAEQTLSALRQAPSTEPVPVHWNGPYLKKDVPLDPWGNAYVYLVPGVHGVGYDLLSLGRDGQEGGDGEDADIVSWE
jgi:general secretion pathway protein G